MLHKLSRRTSIVYLLVLSFVFSIFVAPMQAKAGVLGSIVNFVSPYSRILGQIGGAVAGASLGSAFCPPLGTIGGAILGYVVGGTLGSYAGGGLSNIATLAGATAGYVACASAGPVGMVAGVFLGGVVGKVAYKLLKKLDNATTGGLVFAPEVKEENNNSVSIGDNSTVVLSDDIPVANLNNNNSYSAQSGLITNADMSVAEATKAYQLAYQKYITAARDGANGEEINKAYLEYTEAYNNYRAVTGK